jgi:hypothetical protein
VSGLQPKGYDFLDTQTGNLADTDREREMSKFRTGDRILFPFNTTAMDRMAQERNTPSIAPPLGKPGVAKVRKETLKNTPDKKIIKRGKDYRSRITSRIQNSGVTKRNKASRPELGSRVAALLKPKKSSTKKGDKLG